MAFQNRLIVITGGAGGIARATAKPLVAEGADLLLIDPSAVMLDAAAVELGFGRQVRTAVSALESPEACVKALAGIERPIYAVASPQRSCGLVRHQAAWALSEGLRLG
jgi:NAD(P)-dependent dehydrogenase (short-subunit alcohol dehydrogenase family)